MSVRVDCPTKERTPVMLIASIMHRVIPSYVHTAYYSLSGAEQQVRDYVQNALRGAVPNYGVDELFSSRYELADLVKKDLAEQMERFGREIVDVLIADIEPRHDVKMMYSQQMTQRYNRIANTYRAEAEKIELVKKAEADAEVARLNGIGLAEQRKVVTGGLTLNLHAWQQAEAEGKHLPESEVLATMMMLQYCDMMSQVAKGTDQVKPAVVYMPGSNTSALAGAAGSQLRQRKSAITDDDI